jgi:hypothetical protein
MAQLMVLLTVLVGLESTAHAYGVAGRSNAGHVVAPTLIESLAPVGVPMAHLVRGPHLLARQMKRYRANLPELPAPGPNLELVAGHERRHLVAGTALTIAASVLLANFLWMVIVGAIWFFAYYLPEAGTDVVFPPQAALFFLSFAFLIPGVILLPMGLNELRIYRAIESADMLPLDGGGFPALGRAIASQPRGGWPLVRF